jgi:hypothetical protein
LNSLLDLVVRSVDALETSKAYLSNDGTQFTTSSTDTVCGTAVTSGESFIRKDKGCGVWPDVLEKVGHAAQPHEGILGAKVTMSDHFVVAETHATEDCGKGNESHELNRLAVLLHNEICKYYA